MGLSRSELLVTGWGVVYATWAGLKLLAGLQPTLCEPRPIAQVAQLAAFWESAVGVLVALPATRRLGAVLGIATNLGLVLFSFIAHHRNLPWQGCGCVFVGIEFPWLPGHAIFAAVLAVPFLAILVREEARLRRPDGPPA